MDTINTCSPGDVQNTSDILAGRGKRPQAFRLLELPWAKITTQSSFIYKHLQQLAHTERESSSPAPPVDFYSKTWPSRGPSKN